MEELLKDEFSSILQHTSLIFDDVVTDISTVGDDVESDSTEFDPPDTSLEVCRQKSFLVLSDIVRGDVGTGSLEVGGL